MRRGAVEAAAEAGDATGVAAPIGGAEDGVRVMGIDPGLRLTGYACVRVKAGRRGGFDEGIELVEAGVFRLGTKQRVADRLVELDRDLRETIGRLAPGCAAVEKLYAHYKHPATAITMGHARGVIFLAIRSAGVELVELGATEVKKNLTGNGHASKAQMQGAVAAQMGLAEPPRPADVADAIAVALCAARRMGRREARA